MKKPALTELGSGDAVRALADLINSRSDALEKTMESVHGAAPRLARRQEGGCAGSCNHCMSDGSTGGKGNASRCHRRRTPSGKS